MHMAFSGLTPEALLERSDSKNPATTCKGVTKLGRPCRNPLKVDPAKAARYNGVLAVASVASDSDDEDIGVAAFFCHKHKDQAEQLAAVNANSSTPNKQDTLIYALQNRSSIDTLVARLGVLDVEDRTEATSEKRKERTNGDVTRPHRRRINRPPTWDRVQGPLLEVPSDVMKRRQTQRRQQRKRPGFWASLCCGTAGNDYVEVIRHKKRVDSRPTMSSSTGIAVDLTTQPKVAAASRRVSGNPDSITRPVSSVPQRRPAGVKGPHADGKPSQRSVSETATLLSYIPKTLAPQTASLLLAELSKPISAGDDDGYIYIFWLTPEGAGPAPSSTASSLLAPPSRPEQGRRTSDVLRQYSVKGSQPPGQGRERNRPGAARGSGGENSTILLKIGRANNVHRRMHEWTRQCGYSLSLVRFYPYVPSTPSPSPQHTPNGSPAQSRRPSTQNGGPNQNQRPSDGMRRVSSGVRKVPHVRRVERLIHLELAAQRVLKQCEACGTEHREWFEVDATREGVKAVDEVVKRWVGWAERANVPKAV